MRPRRFTGFQGNIATRRAHSLIAFILQTWLVSYQEITKREPETADRPKWYVPVMSDDLAFRAKMRRLLECSFVGAKLPDDSYTMHPVVYNWYRSMSESRNEPKRAEGSPTEELVFTAVGRIAPTNDDPNS
ncbi:hypothetical protein BDV11DRAFT_77976 [Aspergillus similis]